MKKVLAILLCAVFMFALAIPAMAADITANKTAVGIDGVRDEAYSGPVDIASPRLNASDGFENASGAADGKVWTAWNDGSIYFYIEAYDKTPNQQDTANNDNVEIFIDWNAGRGDPDVASAETPFWQIRVFAGPDADGLHELSGYIREEEADWSGNAVFNDVCEFYAGPLDGSYNNGYVVEIKVPAPAAASLSEGKAIPFDVQICDNMLGEGGREGQMFVGHAGGDIDDNEKWHTAAYLSGVMTLGGAYVAPVIEAVEQPAVGGGGEENPHADSAAPAPVTNPVTGDSAVILISIAIIALAGVYTASRRASRNSI